MIIAPDTTVASIAVSCPRAAAIFERFGLDYCCGGKLALARACEKRGLNVQSVLNALSAAASEPDGETRDWARESLTALVANIETTHHRYLKEELPRLRSLASKVAAAHGQSHPELRTLDIEFDRFAYDMVAHMEQEENVLFPLVRSLERGVRPPAGLDRPIHRMMEEHAEAGHSLEQFETLTNGYTVPMDACSSWRVLVTDLRRLATDLHRHVHKENNILFPRALALEAAERAA